MEMIAYLVQIRYGFKPVGIDVSDGTVEHRLVYANNKDQAYQKVFDAYRHHGSGLYVQVFENL
jgi:hypothetical protein